MLNDEIEKNYQLKKDTKKIQVNQCDPSYEMVMTL